jgi:uncharacterized membrane protein
MTSLPSLPRFAGRLSLALLCLLSFACKSGGGDGGDDVGGPTGAIALSLNPGSATVAQGGSTVVTGTLTRSGGFSGEVSILVANAPSTVNAAAFLETIGSTTTATIAVQVGAATPAQTYDITIIAQASGVATATAHFMLTVTAQQGYAILGVTPSGDVTLAPGTTDNTKTLTISRFNYTASLALTAENLPAGLTVSFSPSLTTGNSAALSITASTSVTPGNYTILLRGTGPSSLQAPGEGGTDNFTAAYTMVVHVTSGGSFTLGVTPTGGVNLQQGTSDNSKSVTITRNNYPGAVTLTAENLPTGLTAAFAPSPTSGNSSTLTLTAAASLAPNTYTITIRGTGPAALKATADSVSLEALTTLSVTVTAAPASGFALGITPAGAVSLQQGTSNNTKTVTINRTNYSSDVTLAAENLPAGLTAAFSPNPASGTSSTLTLSANGTVAPNTYTITIRGTGPSALDATVTVSVTVTAAPTGSFTLSLTPSTSVTLQQGSSDNSRTVGIARNNYTASVTLTAENLPTGLTAAFAPNPASGTSATLTLTASGTVAANTYTITIRGTGPAALRAPGTGPVPALDATVTLTVTVTAAPPASGNVTVSFVYCESASKPQHFWARDGSAAWVKVTGSADRYSFDVFQGKATIVWYNGILRVRYLTQAELTASTPYLVCPPPGSSPRTISVTMSGKTDAFETTFLAFADAERLWGNGVNTLFPTLPGPHDFMAYLSPATGNDRLAIIRDLNPANGASIGTVDMSAAPSMVPATISLAGSPPGSVYFTIRYATGATCDRIEINPTRVSSVGTSFTASGVAAAQQRASDFHNVLIDVLSGPNGERTLEESFHSWGNRTLTLGVPLPVPSVTNLSATRTRYQVAFTLPDGYQEQAVFTYYTPSGPFDGSPILQGEVRASFAWMGSTGSQVLVVPDLSGVPGWSDSFLPGLSSVTWKLMVTGDSSGGNRCVEGARRITANRQG